MTKATEILQKKRTTPSLMIYDVIYEAIPMKDRTDKPSTPPTIRQTTKTTTLN